MSNSPNTIKCPECGNKINVSDILYHQLDEELSKKYKDQLAEEQEKIKEHEQKLEEEIEEIEREKQKYQKKIKEGIQQGIEQEKSKLETSLREKVEKEQSDRIQSLEDELTMKTDQVKELNRSKAEIERLKREKNELREEIELEAEQKLSKELSKEREKIKKSEEDKIKLQISERDQIINQLNEKLKEAQRKAEQGSSQLQGEVQELAIIEWLSGKFPLDKVERVKKGKSGADCIQTVHDISRQNCGTIYYESKRTKRFQPSWIEKFKSDIREQKADIGVLVTEVMPADMEHLGQKEGIWVCSFTEFKGLCYVLRESIIKVSNAIATQQNKGDKMGLLYSFLTSNEFKLQVEGIVEGFSQMKTDLEAEKRAMNSLWSKREKQIEKVLSNTINMYGSIKGIAGNAVQSVPLLELPSGNEDNK